MFGFQRQIIHAETSCQSKGRNSEKLGIRAQRDSEPWHGGSFRASLNQVCVRCLVKHSHFLILTEPGSREVDGERFLIGDSSRPEHGIEVGCRCKGKSPWKKDVVLAQN